MLSGQNCQIEVRSAVDSRVSLDQLPTLIPAISYESYYYKNVGHRKQRFNYTKNLINMKDESFAYFWTGLIPRVQHYLKSRGISCNVIDSNTLEKPYNVNPYVNGIVFRPDQLELINKAINAGRGVIQAPTGTGKTILQMGIISCYPKARSLILAHTLSIVNQTYELFKRNGFEVVKITGDSIRKEKFGRGVCVGTVQTFVNLPVDFAYYWDLVLVDEAHHVSTLGGQYDQVLSGLGAQIRLGFTATLPTEQESVMVLEGLIGPLIAEQTINEAAELNLLAKPKIKIIKSRFNHEVHDLRRYADVYQEGIVNNVSRNRTIMTTAKNYISENKSVLILVTKIEHGQELRNLGKQVFDMDVEFVQGSTSGDFRELVRKKLIGKQVPCVIATAVWREGVDLPSLDVVINASGGKSEIMTLQSIGRGLRKTEDKDHVTIVDFFDNSHHYLINHFGERKTI